MRGVLLALFLAAAIALHRPESVSSPEGGLNQYFGSWIQTAGEITLIGEPGDDAGVPGQVHIYRRNPENGEPVLIQTLSGEAAGDQFGGFFLLNGPILIVGAPKANVAVTLPAPATYNQAGKVYIYKWDFEFDEFAPFATLVSPAPQANGRFGRFMDVDGQVLVISEFRANNVYVFRITPSTVIQTQDVITEPELDEAEEPLAAPNFGRWIAAGRNVIAIGGLQYGGVIYIYQKFNSDGYVYVQTITLEDSETGSFGWEFDFDGEWLIVSDPNTEAGGSIYYYRTDLPRPEPAPFVFDEPSNGPGRSWSLSDLPRGWTTGPKGPRPNHAGAKTPKMRSYRMEEESNNLAPLKKRSTSWTSSWTSSSSSSSKSKSAPQFRPPTYSQVEVFYQYFGVYNNPTLDPNDQFGFTIAVGNNQVLVGAIGAIEGNGAAYILNRWRSTVTVADIFVSSAEDPTNGAFGTGLDFAGGEIVIGAPAEDGEAGNAYFFGKSPRGSSSKSKSGKSKSSSSSWTSTSSSDDDSDESSWTYTSSSDDDESSWTYTSSSDDSDMNVERLKPVAIKQNLLHPISINQIKAQKTEKVEKIGMRIAYVVGGLMVVVVAAAVMVSRRQRRSLNERSALLSVN